MTSVSANALKEPIQNQRRIFGSGIPPLSFTLSESVAEPCESAEINAQYLSRGMEEE